MTLEGQGFADDYKQRIDMLVAQWSVVVTGRASNVKTLVKSSQEFHSLKQP